MNCHKSISHHLYGLLSWSSTSCTYVQSCRRIMCCALATFSAVSRGVAGDTERLLKGCLLTRFLRKDQDFRLPLVKFTFNSVYPLLPPSTFESVQKSVSCVGDFGVINLNNYTPHFWLRPGMIYSFLNCGAIHAFANNMKRTLFPQNNFTR